MLLGQCTFHVIQPKIDFLWDSAGAGQKQSDSSIAKSSLCTAVDLLQKFNFIFDFAVTVYVIIRQLLLMLLAARVIYLIWLENWSGQHSQDFSMRLPTDIARLLRQIVTLFFLIVIIYLLQRLLPTVFKKQFTRKSALNTKNYIYACFFSWYSSVGQRTVGVSFF